MDKPDTIELIACISPDGHLAFAWDIASARDHCNDWRENQPDEKRDLHQAGNTYGGFVQIKMLRADWDAMNMTSPQSST